MQNSNRTLLERYPLTLIESQRHREIKSLGFEGDDADATSLGDLAEEALGLLGKRPRPLELAGLTSGATSAGGAYILLP